MGTFNYVLSPVATLSGQSSGRMERWRLPCCHLCPLLVHAHIATQWFGYLFLHANAQLARPFIGKVLLLSPIVGEFANNDEARPMNFLPPRSTRLMELAESGSYPTPKHCEMHVGSEDWQSNPVNVTKFGELVGIPVHVVPDGGHMLPKEYVSAILDKWLQ